MESKESYCQRVKQIKCLICTNVHTQDIMSMEYVRQLFDKYNGSKEIVSVSYRKNKKQIFVNFSTREAAVYCLNNIPCQGLIKDENGKTVLMAQIYNPVVMQLSFFDRNHKFRKICKARNVMDIIFDIESVLNSDGDYMYRVKIKFGELGFIMPNDYCNTTCNAIQLAVKRSVQILKDHFMFFDRIKNRSTLKNLNSVLPKTFKDTAHLRYTSVYCGDEITSSKGSMLEETAIMHYDKVKDSDDSDMDDFSDYSGENDDSYSSYLDLSSDDEQGEYIPGIPSKIDYRGDTGALEGDKKSRCNDPVRNYITVSNTNNQIICNPDFNEFRVDQKFTNVKPLLDFNMKNCNAVKSRQELEDEYYYLKYKAYREREMAYNSHNPVVNGRNEWNPNYSYENAHNTNESYINWHGRSDSSKCMLAGMSSNAYAGYAPMSDMSRHFPNQGLYRSHNDRMNPNIMMQQRNQRYPVMPFENCENRHLNDGNEMFSPINQNMVMLRNNNSVDAQPISSSRSCNNTLMVKQEFKDASNVKVDDLKIDCTNKIQLKTNLWMEEGKFRGFDSKNSSNSIKEFVPMVKHNEVNPFTSKLSKKTKKECSDNLKRNVSKDINDGKVSKEFTKNNVINDKLIPGKVSKNPITETEPKLIVNGRAAKEECHAPQLVRKTTPLIYSRSMESGQRYISSRNVETYVMKSNDVNIDKTNETKNPEKLVSHGFKNDRTKEENCRVKHPRNAG